MTGNSSAGICRCYTLAVSERNSSFFRVLRSIRDEVWCQLSSFEIIVGSIGPCSQKLESSTACLLIHHEVEKALSASYDIMPCCLL